MRGVVMKIAIAGAGVAGLAGAAALAAQGHTIELLERDAAPVPSHDDLASGALTAEDWKRPGVPQMRHSHAFLARLRNLLATSAPDLLEELLRAGVREVGRLCRLVRLTGVARPAEEAVRGVLQLHARDAEGGLAEGRPRRLRPLMMASLTSLTRPRQRCVLRSIGCGGKWLSTGPPWPLMTTSALCVVATSTTPTLRPSAGLVLTLGRSHVGTSCTGTASSLRPIYHGA